MNLRIRSSTGSIWSKKKAYSSLSLKGRYTFKNSKNTLQKMGRRMHLWHLRTSLLHVCFDLLLLSLEYWQHLSKFKRKEKEKKNVSPKEGEKKQL